MSFKLRGPTGREYPDCFPSLREEYQQQLSPRRMTNDNLTLFRRGMIGIVMDASERIGENAERFGEGDAVLP